MSDTATLPNTASDEKIAVEVFRAPGAKWWQATGFMLMLSLIGLQFYPIILAVIILLTWRWRHDHYAFMVEVMLLLGGFGFLPGYALPIPASDIGLVLGIIGFVIYRKNKTVKRITGAMILYFLAIILIAMTSLESMSVQVYRMRNYMAIIAFFIPLLVFVNRSFDWSKFREAFVIHTLIICGFYVIDTFIIGGYILLPAVTPGSVETTFYAPYISGFLQMPRHYPTGLYWLMPCVIWLNRKKLKFSPIQWIVIILALFSCRTNTLLFALAACWIFSRPQLKQILLYIVVGIVCIVGLYYLDNATGRHLRFADNIEQFTSLEAAQDEEDIAEFGSGRMAQIIPKWMLLEELDRVDLGFGFIHPTRTTNPIFMIHNELYNDSSKAEEIATEVEVAQVQTIFDIGVVGLILQTVFYVGIYFIIRRMPYSRDYLNAIIGISVLGIGGYSGLSVPHGQILIAIILGAIILANKPNISNNFH